MKLKEGEILNGIWNGSKISSNFKSLLLESIKKWHKEEEQSCSKFIQALLFMIKASRKCNLKIFILIERMKISI